MSDDIFDWGEAGEPKTKDEVEAEKHAERQKAYAAAREAADAAKLARRLKEDNERIEKAKSIKESVSADKVSTHIWIGLVSDNIRTETKNITGKILPATNYVRLSPIVAFGTNNRATWHMASKMSPANLEVISQACAIRLTKEMAAKAKLSNAGKQVILEDTHGIQWQEINSLVVNCKQRTAGVTQAELIKWFGILAGLA